jgi:hypothetical protein
MVTPRLETLEDRLALSSVKPIAATSTQKDSTAVLPTLKPGHAEHHSHGNSSPHGNQTNNHLLMESLRRLDNNTRNNREGHTKQQEARMVDHDAGPHAPGKAPHREPLSASRRRRGDNSDSLTEEELAQTRAALDQLFSTEPVSLEEVLAAGVEE